MEGGARLLHKDGITKGDAILIYFLPMTGVPQFVFCTLPYAA
jgi:hypothetical protein